MTPHLTRSGRWIVATIALFLAYGAAVSSPPVVLAGEALLGLVALLYLVGIVRMWAVEAGAVVAEVHRPPTGELHTGETVSATLRLHNAGWVGLGRVRLSPVTTSGVSLDGLEMPGAVPPRSRLDVPVDLRAHAAGRWTVHGLRATLDDIAGFVRVPTYVPIAHHVKVWPARRGAVAPRLAAARRRAIVPTGANVASRAGHGIELRELRDYAPGDPLRRVDWKATARRRTLTVRQHEDEVVLDIAVAIDISSTMRGRVRFEHALELGQDLVHATALRGDRIGIVSFDDRVYGALGQGSGAAHYRRAAEHLVGLANVADERLTEPSSGDVIMAVVSYLLVHERLDFRRPHRRGGALDEFAPVSELVDTDLLARWTSDRVETEAGPLEAELAAAGLPIDRADSVRRFARVRGIEIPYRAESRLGRKAAGIAEAIDAAVDGQRAGGVVFVVTDFGGVVAPDRVGEALRRAAARRTPIVFAVPFAPDYARAPEEGVDAVVFEQLASAEATGRVALDEALRAHSATVVHCGPDVSAAHLLAVAGSRRR